MEMGKTQRQQVDKKSYIMVSKIRKRKRRKQRLRWRDEITYRHYMDKRKKPRIEEDGSCLESSTSNSGCDSLGEMRKR